MHFDEIERATTGDPRLAEMLRGHPRVRSVQPGTGPDLAFVQAGRERVVCINSPSEPLFGLVEMMDNNPLVCADRFSVPGPGETLALIALGPLADAGLILEPPAWLSNLPADEASLAASLASVGWQQGVTPSEEPDDGTGILRATAIVAISTPENPAELDGLYEERFGRSFFVRRQDKAGWSRQTVAGEPFAVYDLRLSPGDDASLLTVYVMADRQGKCGAAQIVHAMNVMAGFEETLGLALV